VAWAVLILPLAKRLETIGIPPMIRDIILYPDKRLETPCDAVEEFDTDDLNRLLNDMFETMYANKGLGLAAPQIGIMKQIAVIDASSGKDLTQRIVLINPTISDMQGSHRDSEGCLCFPGFSEQITRSMTVTVNARNAAGVSIQLRGVELLARAFQHEIDHLNRILFIRRMSSLKRELIRRKIQKLLRKREWGTRTGVAL
jgi:peptide deformylase